MRPSRYGFQSLSSTGRLYRQTGHEDTIAAAIHLMAGQVAARDFAGGIEKNGVFFRLRA